MKLEYCRAVANTYKHSLEKRGLGGLFKSMMKEIEDTEKLWKKSEASPVHNQVSLATIPKLYKHPSCYTKNGDRICNVFYDDEPGAGIFLNNMLSWACAYQGDEPCIEPIGGEILPASRFVAAVPLIAVLIAAVALNAGVLYRKKPN